MGWEDRPYYRNPGRAAGNPLMWFLTGSVPLFTVFGIRVRMHASMIITISLTLIFAETRGGLGWQNALTSMTILFVSVLLHEFGHCFGARWVGGEARDILMWPLGGLAFVEPPHRPLPSLITTAMGPAVNLAICIVTGTVLFIMNRSAGNDAIPWYPFGREGGIRSYVPSSWTTYYIWWVFLVNYALLMFNLLLLFYPFDGGRIVQELLWFKIGYYRSMRFATVVGMVGAVAVAAFGLATLSFMLVLIAAFGFYTCYQQRQMLREMGPEEFENGVNYAASLAGGASGGYGEPRTARGRRPSRFSRWAAARARKRARAEEDEQVKIDAILAKVSAHGMHSLTWWEKRVLRKATERQRKRDTELSRGRGHH